MLMLWNNFLSVVLLSPGMLTRIMLVLVSRRDRGKYSSGESGATPTSLYRLDPSSTSPFKENVVRELWQTCSV